MMCIQIQSHILTVCQSYLQLFYLFLASCPVKGQTVESCPSCQGTCDNPVVSCPLSCTDDGCVCPPGQLIDTEANECVHPSQCPVKCSVSYS